MGGDEGGLVRKFIKKNGRILCREKIIPKRVVALVLNIGLPLFVVLV